MGTKVQPLAFLPEYRSVIDHLEVRKNGYSGHEVERVRQTIIEHESIFRNQLQELHRLYGRQKELMNEIKKDKCLPVFSPPQETRSLRTFLKGTDKVIGVPCDSYASKNQVSCDRHIKLSLASVPTCQQQSSDALGFDFYSKSTTKTPGHSSVSNQKIRVYDELTLSSGANRASGFNLEMKDFYRNSLEGMNGKSCTSTLRLRNGKGHAFEFQGIEKGSFDKQSSVKDFFCSGKSLLAEPRKELPHYPYTHTSASRKKKKIFGVEISEVDEYPLNASSNISTTLDKKIGPRQENHHIVSFNKPPSWAFSSCTQNIDLARNNVPCQLTESEPGKCSKNCVDVNSKPVDFQSNHENRKNGLPWFLKNSQVHGDWSKGEKNSYFMNLDSLQSYSEKFFRKAETAEGKLHTLKQETEMVTRVDSARQGELDGNSKMKQVETKEPNLSRHHIDLNLSLDDEAHPEVSYEECEKFAADAIVEISSFPTKRNSRKEEPCERLKWFADVISSDQNRIPDGIDDFEFMTLSLEEVKEEQHYREPVELKTPTSDMLLPAKRSSRRGRQRRRDFQRDILPGLITLSRLEVTEDFQTFQQLMKAEGGPARNGRGRKRLEGPVEKPVCRPEGRSLTGWGRRTRRLPRQRCASAFVDFSVKSITGFL